MNCLVFSLLLRAATASVLLPIVIASTVSFFPFRFDSLTLDAAAPNITEARTTHRHYSVTEWLFFVIYFRLHSLLLKITPSKSMHFFFVIVVAVVVLDVFASTVYLTLSMSHLCIIDAGFSRRRENDFASVWILCCLRTSTWDYIIIFVTFCFLSPLICHQIPILLRELVCGRFDTKSLPSSLSIGGGGRSFCVRARNTDFFLRQTYTNWTNVLALQWAGQKP